MPKLLLLLVISTALLSPCLGQTEILYCGDNTAEPTIADILGSILPSGITDTAQSFSESDSSPIGKTIHDLVSTITGFSIPLSTAISDGEYTVYFNNPNSLFGFNSVSLLQKPPVSQSFLCKALGDKISKSFCDCRYGSKYEDSDVFDKNKHSQFEGYCVSKPCSENSYRQGTCEFQVDPFRRSCVYIDNARGGNGNDVDNEVVSYKQTVPTYAALIYGESDGSPGAARATASKFKLDLDDPSTWSFALLLRAVLPALPFYLTNGLLGFYLFVYAEDMMEYDVTITVMKGLYGILLAFVILFYVMYRTSSKMLDRFGGGVLSVIQIPALLTMSIPMLSMLFLNPALPPLLLKAVWAFWDTGYPIVGVPWLGKVYFSLSVVASYYLSWLFGWFNTELIEIPPTEAGGVWTEKHTLSWTVMMYSIKAMGFLFLLFASSGSEMVVILMLIAFFNDSISHFCWSMHLSYTAMTQTPTYTYMNGRITMEEAAELSKQTTEKALSDLRGYLQSNPDEMYKQMDLMTENGRESRADLLKRFSEYKYPGVPYTTKDDDDEDSGKHRCLKVVGFLLMAVAVIAGLYIAGLQQEKQASEMQ